MTEFPSICTVEFGTFSEKRGAQRMRRGSLLSLPLLRVREAIEPRLRTDHTRFMLLGTLRAPIVQVALVIAAMAVACTALAQNPSPSIHYDWVYNVSTFLRCTV